VYKFTKLHDRRIPKVRVGVGVGPMEFQLMRSHSGTRFSLCDVKATFNNTDVDTDILRILEDGGVSVGVDVGIVECALNGRALSRLKRSRVRISAEPLLTALDKLLTHCHQAV